MFFFFNDTATTEIYTLSLHDALPIFSSGMAFQTSPITYILRPFVSTVVMSPLYCNAVMLSSHCLAASAASALLGGGDRKSTRLNSSHANISYAVFCLKKKITHTRILF